MNEQINEWKANTMVSGARLPSDYSTTSEQFNLGQIISLTYVSISSFVKKIINNSIGWED